MRAGRPGREFSLAQVVDASMVTMPPWEKPISATRFASTFGCAANGRSAP